MLLDLDSAPHLTHFGYLQAEKPKAGKRTEAQTPALSGLVIKPPTCLKAATCRTLENLSGSKDLKGADRMCQSVCKWHALSISEGQCELREKVYLFHTTGKYH